MDDRRHSEVVHLAKAISIRDFHDQVAKCCPEGTLIPSDEWFHLQFWPKTSKAKVNSLHWKVKCLLYGTKMTETNTS